jgi:hypothetical protein
VARRALASVNDWLAIVESVRGWRDRHFWRQSTKTIRKLIAVIATSVSLCLLRSCCPRQTEEENSMAATLNRRAYEHAKELITEGRFIFDERDAWSEHRPSAEEENEFIRLHSFAEYGKWYLGLNDEKPEETKGHYEFPHGDFKDVHRCGRKGARANINIMTSRTRRRTCTGCWTATRPHRLRSAREQPPENRPRDPTFGAMTGSPFQRFTIQRLKTQKTRLSNRLTSKHVISGK